MPFWRRKKPPSKEEQEQETAEQEHHQRLVEYARLREYDHLPELLARLKGERSTESLHPFARETMRHIIGAAHVLKEDTLRSVTTLEEALTHGGFSLRLFEEHADCYLPVDQNGNYQTEWDDSDVLYPEFPVFTDRELATLFIGDPYPYGKDNHYTDIVGPMRGREVLRIAKERGDTVLGVNYWLSTAGRTHRWIIAEDRPVSNGLFDIASLTSVPDE